MGVGFMWFMKGQIDEIITNRAIKKYGYLPPKLQKGQQFGQFQPPQHPPQFTTGEVNRPELKPPQEEKKK